MEVKVTESDLRAVINQQAATIASLQMSNAALGRTIGEMDVAQATKAEEKPAAKTK